MATPYQWYADNRLAELRMLQGFATSAQTNGSPQVRALMEMLARNVFGAEGLDSMALGDIQLMQYAMGTAIDNGVMPYVDDGAVSYERLYQMAKATGQFQGVGMEDRGALTYALHQRMQSAIYGPDGSTNYVFTGGLDGNMASQLYTELMRKELASGRTRLTGTNVGIAQGSTYAARVQSMLKNAEKLQASGEMTSSELMRYQSAARSANRELGTETAVQYKLLKDALAANGLTLSDAERAMEATGNYAGLLQSENVLNQLAKRYEGIADKDTFNNDAVSFYAGERDDAVDLAVMRRAVLESRQGKNTRILGVDAIQDASVGEVLLGVGTGDLAVTRTGTVTGRDISRNAGESLGDFVRRVVSEAAGYNDENGGGTTSESMAELKRLAGTYGVLEANIRKRKGDEKYNVTDADIREEIANAYGGKDGYRDMDRSFIEGVGNLDKLLDEGRARTDVLQNGTDQIDGKVKELFDRYGRTIRSLQDIFGTDNLNVLQRGLDELHWGSLTNEKDLQRISDNMESVFGIAQVSGRSVQSVMLERKGLAKALSAMSGGDAFVSDGEIAMMQTALQEIDRASQSGSSISKEEAVAKLKRSVDNALSLDNFGGAAAAEGILASNRNLFSDAEAADFEAKIKYVKDTLANPNSTFAQRDDAKAVARELSYRLREDYGFNDLEQRRAAVKYADPYGSRSAYNGLVNRFAEAIETLGPQGARIFGTDAERTAGRTTFATLLDVFGNVDPGRFNEFRVALEGGQLDQFLARHGELAGSEEQLRAVAAAWQGMTKAQRQGIIKEMGNQTGGLYVGSAARNLQTIAGWDAFVQASSDTSLGVRKNASDGLIGGFIRGLLNGDEAPVTAEQAVLNDMWDEIYGPNRQEYAHGGQTIEDRVQALRKLFSSDYGKKRFGDAAMVLGINNDFKAGGSAYTGDVYRKALEQAGYSEDEIENEVKAFNELNTVAERGARMRRMLEQKGFRFGIADGAVYIADDAKARSTAVEDERAWKALAGIDFSAALKDDGTVSRDELMNALGRGNFENGVYTGPIDKLKGKTAEQLVDAGVKGSFNYKGNEGDRTLAQMIEDRHHSNGVVETIATEVGTFTGQFKSIYDLLKDWRNDSRRDNAETRRAEEQSVQQISTQDQGFGDAAWVNQDVHDHITPSEMQGTAAIASTVAGDNLAAIAENISAIRNVVVVSNGMVENRQYNTYNPDTWGTTLVQYPDTH